MADTNIVILNTSSYSQIKRRNSYDNNRNICKNSKIRNGNNLW